MAHFIDKAALGFDDVCCSPEYSSIKSRKKVDLSTELGKLILKIPIISANMLHITGVEMAVTMSNLGGLGILHRYAHPNTIIEWINYLSHTTAKIIPSVGVTDNDYNSAKVYREHGIDSICIDIAHGDSKLAVQMVEFCKQKLNFYNIIAGNVATSQGVNRLYKAGANIIKCGISNGANCTTKLMTGFGVPQLTTVLECAEEADKISSNGNPCDIISDGGIKNPQDCVKALGAGAKCVMIGNLLSGTSSCPPNAKNSDGTYTYSGMASKEAREYFEGQSLSDYTPEGVTTIVPFKGSTENVINMICGGIRSGCSYAGASNLTELRKNIIFRKVWK